jgi:hypothetical protein
LAKANELIERQEFGMEGITWDYRTYPIFRDMTDDEKVKGLCEALGLVVADI